VATAGNKDCLSMALSEEENTASVTKFLEIFLFYQINTEFCEAGNITF